MTDLSLLDQCPTLRDQLAERRAFDPRGNAVPIHSEIRVPYAEALFRVTRQERPMLVIEVGMAFGTSALAILTAMAGEDRGRLISIDPNQSTQWKGCGVTSVQRAGYADRHQLVEEPDYYALPALLKQRTRIDLAYIDGWHTFDYALVDAWYLDKMLRVGGILAFNDCGMPAVHKVIGWLRTHRNYDELDVGLNQYAVNYSRMRGLKRRLTGAKPADVYRFDQDRYFRKRDDVQPEWNFFADF